jgi:hypothetical protein
LRTGQPGQAPEHDVIAAYDINDYKEKTELTAQKLATTLYAALRSYRDMRTIEAQRRGLERVISASARIFSHQTSRDFPSAVLAQLADLVGIRHGVLLCSVPKVNGYASAHYRVTAATGEYRPLVGREADEGLRPALVDSLRLAHRHERHHFADDHYVLHFRRRPRR